MSESAPNAPAQTPNDEEILVPSAVCIRLVRHCPRADHIPRATGKLDFLPEPSSSRGKTSRQNSVRSERPKELKLDSNGEHRVDGNRSRVSSYSSRANDEQRLAKSSRPKDSESFRHEKPRPSESERSGYDHSYGSLKRDRRRPSNGRDSRASEKSFRSEGLTDEYLRQYYQDWLRHSNMQHQHQPMNMYGYGGMSQLYSPMATTGMWPQPVMSKPASSADLVGMAATTAAGTPSVPLTPGAFIKTHGEQLPAVATPFGIRPSFPGPSLNSAFKPISTRSDAVPVRRTSVVAKPLRPRFWRGCLLSSVRTAEIVRTGRSSAVVIKANLERDFEKHRSEMEIFPGMMLWDEGDLRERVVDFCRHMSSLARDADDTFVSEMESVFWDLVVHLLTCGENSRPYEVAQILSRLLQDPGRSSVASLRSELNGRTGRERYSESQMILVRRCMLAGDIESAVIHAENGECWELAMCLQTIHSDIECKNHQAVDLMMRTLDQKLQRGDPVHTVCSLACGKMPSVESCFKDWVSNLAAVLACSGFIRQATLRSKFIDSLAELLHLTGLPMGRDICAIFGSPERRFEMQPFTLIGGNDQEFQLSHFFMTEVFVYLAQILQGINLHANADLIRMELIYVQSLLDNDLNVAAMEYCRSIVIVLKDYGVQMAFEKYAQLFQMVISNTLAAKSVMHEEWFRWIWNIFNSYCNKQTSTAPIVERNDVMSLSSATEFAAPQEIQPGNVIFYEPVSESNSSRRESFSMETDAPSLTPMETENEAVRRDSQFSGSNVFETVEFRRGSSVERARSDSLSVSRPITAAQETGQESTAPVIPFFPVAAASNAPPHSMFMPTFKTQELPSPDSSTFNTGNAEHFASITATDELPTESEDDKENVPAQIYDPTRMYDDLDQMGKPPVKQTGNESAPTQPSSRWFPNIFGKNTLVKNVGKSIFSKFGRSKQIHLPDDSKKTLIYDEKKKRWIDTSKPDSEQEAAVPPPPKLDFPQPNFSQPKFPGAFPPGAPVMPSIPNGNMFRLGAGPSNAGYNPYATIMSSLQAAPLKPIDLANHFIPAPTIPEE
ncbi:protein transport protein Sec16A-like [Paramacrobiotus metropolitanus]|uniref:protein transport protein Sec16A-like n=1 Tax=Paramacrobiotus metropolitanus TaxID=2943436 RepID=UPI002445EF96|nr:protein transport protein Sec16A-like [Paramacrobiotus metropolitanus]